MYNIAIIGATGLVGLAILNKLKEENIAINDLKLFASKKSAGTNIEFQNRIYTVEELDENSFEDLDIAFFCAGSSVSSVYVPLAIKKGILVVDNSSYFRLHDDVALVIPEVNIEDAKTSRLIANPNCSTIEALLPIKALHDKYTVTRIQYTTYQATSGSGMKGLLDLERTLKGEKPLFYPYDISKTCIPEIDSALDNLYTKEEMKMVYETRKILHEPNLLISATCVRVPVPNSHAISIALELKKPFKLEEIKKTLSDFPGIRLIDDLKNHQYPTSLHANDNDFVYVGRIRYDLSSTKGVLIYVVADNIRKGAASNAVGIIQAMMKKGWI